MKLGSSPLFQLHGCRLSSLVSILWRMEQFLSKNCLMGITFLDWGGVSLHWIKFNSAMAYFYVHGNVLNYMIAHLQ